MNLDDVQKTQVRAWLEQGLQLSEIQKRLETEFGVRSTYLDVKMLVSDLAILPKDPEPTNRAETPTLTPGQAGKPAGKPAASTDSAAQKPSGARPKGVSISVDHLAKPGAIVSGSVTFTDGKTGEWYVDELGRLGLGATESGYRPSQADMRDFQIALEQELARQGF